MLPSRGDGGGEGEDKLVGERDLATSPLDEEDEALPSEADGDGMGLALLAEGDAFGIAVLETKDLGVFLLSCFLFFSLESLRCKGSPCSVVVAEAEAKTRRRTAAAAAAKRIIIMVAFDKSAVRFVFVS